MKATMKFKIVHDDGKGFSGGKVSWDNLDREQANALEGKITAFLDSLNKWGAEVAKGKAQG